MIRPSRAGDSMRIVNRYSHLNGQEFLQVHKPGLLEEIESVIAAIDAAACRTKVSKEKRTRGELFFSPVELNKRFTFELKQRGWKQRKASYWVTSDPQTIRQTLSLEPKAQLAAIKSVGADPISSYNQTDFVKERVAIEVQLGKYAFVAHDLFVKHLAFYVGDVIDIGVEILPMKEMQRRMSSGVAFYEGGLYNVIRQGRGVPSVPLLMLGIAP